jgi:hypothetical protein
MCVSLGSVRVALEGLLSSWVCVGYTCGGFGGIRVSRGCRFRVQDIILCLISLLVVIFRALNIALQWFLDIFQRIFELWEVLANEIAFMLAMCFDS